MDNLKLFRFNESKLRMVVKEETPYFLARDVCDILEIKNVSKAVGGFTKGITTSDTLTKGGVQKLLYINESNLYKLVFKSRKIEAEKFIDWVTEKVIPSIRDTGSYQIKPLTHAEMFLKQAQMSVDQEKRLDVIENKLNNIKNDTQSIVKQTLKKEQIGVFPKWCIDLKGIRDKYFRGISESNISIFLQHINHSREEYKSLIKGNEVRSSLVYEETGLSEAYRQLVKESAHIKDTDKNYIYNNAIIGTFRIKKKGR